MIILGGLIFTVYVKFIRQNFPAEPALSAAIQRDTIFVGDIERSYNYYVPSGMPQSPKSPLIIVLHGSTDNGEGVRKQTAYEFDRLSDEHQFIVVYPDGYENHWNDCRKNATYLANTLNIDDVEFIRALIARFKNNFAVDASRVFVTGFSNGAQMSFRLALELPEEISAIAAVAANLPSESNFDCKDLKIAMPVMIMNGTDDPINPFGGGEVGLFGYSRRGLVVSAYKSVNFWRQRAGHKTNYQTYRYPDINEEDGSWAEKITWEAPSLPEVSLYTVHGGGHTIPQMKFEFPGLLGNTNTDISGPEEIWRFFQRQNVGRRKIESVEIERGRQ